MHKSGDWHHQDGGAGDQASVPPQRTTISCVQTNTAPGELGSPVECQQHSGQHDLRLSAHKKIARII